MNQIERIMRIINLLESRNCVTMEMIQGVCNIPKRTAYRYLNKISEANIPLTYDRKKGGYTLNTDTRSSLRNVDQHTAILIILALEYAASQADKNLSKEFKVIAERLIRGLGEGLEILKGTFDPESRQAGSLREGINHSLLLYAASTQSKIRVTFNGGDESTISKPCFEFNQGWKLRGVSPSGPQELPLDEIDYVKIVEY